MIGETVPSSEGGGGHREVLRLLDGAGHVVGQVVPGLHGLAELDDHHVGESVAVLVRATVSVSGLETRTTSSHSVR